MANVDGMPWFKWWVGTAEDPKFRMIAESCETSVSSVLGIWAYLLERASKSLERGTIEPALDVSLMAYTLRISEKEIETVRNGMKRCGLVTENGVIVKWEERQAKREKYEPSGASTKRVQALRAREKAKQISGLDAGDSGDGDVTDETAGNGTERPKKKRKSREDIKPKTSSSSVDDGDGEKASKPFDQFYAAYPRKVAKAEAQKAWVKLKPDAELLALILTAVESQKAGADWLRDDGQYIPHPATWLRAGRWLDEVRPYVAPPPKLPAGWWETHQSLKDAGAMLNPPLTPNTGEMKEDFRRRINRALGNEDRAPQQYAVVEPARKIDRPYVPPTVPDGVQLTPEQLDARKQEFREQLAKLKQAGGMAVAGVAASNDRQAA